MQTSQPVNYTLDENLLRHAIKLHLRRLSGRFPPIATYILLGAFIFAPSPFFSDTPVTIYSYIGYFLLTALWAVFFTLGTRWIAVRRTIAAYRQNSVAQQPRQVFWDDLKVTSEQPDCKVSHPWSDIKYWCHNENAIVLSLAGPAFLPLPTSALDVAQFEDLQTKLKAAGIRKARLLWF